MKEAPVRPRVLHVTRDLPGDDGADATGGVSTAVAGLLEAASAHGVEQAALSLDHWRPSRRGPSASPLRPPCSRGGVAVQRLSHPDHLSAGRAFATRFAPTVVHLHEPLAWQFATDVAGAARAAVVFHVHVDHAAQRRILGHGTPTASEQAARSATAAAHALAAPSKGAAEALEAAGAVGAVHVVPPALPASWLAGTPEGSWDAAWPAGAPPAVLYAGRFSFIKGTDLLAEALDAVLGAIPTARVVIAGGNPASGRSDRRWRRRFASAVASGRVTLPGWLDPAALTAARRACGVFIAPSRTETFGLATLEAMLHGQAIVASRCPAHEALLGRGGGVLVPPGDAAALSQGLSSMLRDDTARAAHGRVALAAARARLDAGATARALARLYDAASTSART